MICVSASICASSSFRHGIYVNSSPPASSKLSFISSLISSNVSMQSAENACAITAIRFLPFSSARRATSSTVYGFNHSSGPNLDWKVVTISVSAHPKRSFRSRVVFWHWQWVGIALHQVAFWNAVV